MNDLRSRLAAADPGLPAPPDPALFESITRSRPARRRYVLGAAAAAVAAAVALVAPVVSLDGAPSASAEAVDVLDDAVGAMVLTDPDVAPGDFWLVGTDNVWPLTTGGVEPGKEGGQPPEGSYLVRHVRQQWFPAAGDGLTYWVDRQEYLSKADGSALPPGDYARTSTEAMAYPQAPYGGSWQTPTAAWLAELPRDPAALRERLYADAGGHGRNDDSSAFTYTVDVLRTGMVPPDLRAALYRVLKTVPGVGVASRTAAIDGETGIAIGRPEPSDGSSQEIVIDPSDGELVGITETYPDGSRSTTTMQRELVHGVPADVTGRAVVCDEAQF